MNLAAPPLRLVESVDRRVLGAFQLVDATTRLPLILPANAEVRRVSIIERQPDGTVTEIQPVSAAAGTVPIRQNRRGRFVIFGAPLFDRYVSEFTEPTTPALLAAPRRRLRLQIDLTGLGPHHLPRTFAIDLPRALDRAAADSVFVPQSVELFRSPAAPCRASWAVLRVRVVRAGTGAPLPGVLIRIFRRPRQPGDLAIGAGLSEWRDSRLRGEALVPVAGLPRFLPGAGDTVIETTHPIELEVTRDNAFSGAPGTLPGIDRLPAGIGPGIVRPPLQPAGSVLHVLRPATPSLAIAAGQELAVELEMP